MLAAILITLALGIAFVSILSTSAGQLACEGTAMVLMLLFIGSVVLFFILLMGFGCGAIASA